ncbi:cholinesterase [Pseudomassariella vexata]|uniref:Carboxylic ester hydrolase n=1 Tax=Pseudomassariella vexata TaxID=1141098 RepID=A0A1Y2DBD5_9PEZI|nr:cholinesterase [Pseudomassariella vexata]ORY56582.1 cholinesterase [Pseudomassariella vexata]
MKLVKSSPALWGFFTLVRGISSAGPVANVLNGSYTGVYSSEYGQDWFLGMPYAQQPLGDRRFRNPQSLNEAWTKARNATEYSPACVGYGSDQLWYPVGEDCLTLNVIRPAGVGANSSLPVAVWIHGGGLRQGSSRDQRYNLSFIVDHSVKIGKPFIGVSLNYRLGPWGFLYSNDVLGSGDTNVGLRDQRLALHWIQENIRSFGGDRAKVTIWGQSSGGTSVGSHMVAYGGRNDNLFRAAIQESGGILNGQPFDTTKYQPIYDNLVIATNCTDAIDRLECLRSVPYTRLNGIFNGTNNTAYNSFVQVPDGDFYRGWGSYALKTNSLNAVPLLIGSNTDEGTSMGPTGIDTEQEFYQYLTNGSAGYKLPSTTARQMLKVYPDDPSIEIAAYLGNAKTPNEGLQWRRTSTYTGDLRQHTGRRWQCQTWAANDMPAYCYRFNVHSNDVPWINGAAHFTEVAFVFNNLDGVGYHSGLPFNQTPPSYVALSNMMASMWVSFIVDGDPNSAGVNTNY